MTGDTKIAQLLIKNDVFLDAKDGDEDTPLSMSIFKRKNAMMVFLIEQGIYECI
jgi:ankyrin repeat protein